MSCPFSLSYMLLRSWIGRSVIPCLLEVSDKCSLQGQHLECSHNEPTEGPRSRRTAAQYCSHDIFRTLYPFRDPIKHPDEEVSTAHMALVLSSFLGGMDLLSSVPSCILAFGLVMLGQGFGKTFLTIN